MGSTYTIQEIAEQLELRKRRREEQLNELPEHQMCEIGDFRYEFMQDGSWPSEYKYIIYEFMKNNMLALGTLKPYEDHASARSAALALTKSRSEFDFILLPVKYIEYKRKRKCYLVFPEVFTSLRHWLNAFAWHRQPHPRPPPKTLLTVFGQIGSAVQQLFIREKSFNDLEKAICITEGNKVFFCDEPGDPDFSATILFLEQTARSMVHCLHDSNIIKKFDGFKSFVDVKYRRWLANGRFDGRVMAMFVLYHPIFWNEEVTVRFLGNLGRLGAESKGLADCLGSNRAFITHIYDSEISNWRDLVRNYLEDPILGRVLQCSNYQRGDLPRYVLNTMKHHWQHAKNFHRPLPQLKKKEVVNQLCRVLNGLVDILFGAYADAVFTGQYNHSTLTPFDVLTKDT